MRSNGTEAFASCLRKEMSAYARKVKLMKDVYFNFLGNLPEVGEARGFTYKDSYLRC